jgi:acyl-CoA thioesterase-1
MHLSLFFKLLLMFILTAISAFANSATAGPVTVLALGDSLTAGYGLEQDESFPAQLEKGLLSAGYAVKVVNAGVSGDTSAGGLARIEWALADRPQIVVVELGANDALRGLDPAQTHANLDQIIARLNRAGCRVILAGMQSPRNLGPDYNNTFDQIYPTLAKRYDLLFYPFFLEGVATDPELNQVDGIHPNSAGVRLIVEGLQPLVAMAIDELIASEANE